MTKALNREIVRHYLDGCDLYRLFIDELGWDNCGDNDNIDVPLSNLSISLEAVAQKRGMVLFQYIAKSGESLPNYAMRRQIERATTKLVYEHIIVYSSHDLTVHNWQWVKREHGKPERVRQHTYRKGDTGEGLIQKLERLAFTLEEEEELTLAKVRGAVRNAFDVEKVTKKFYERFKEELQSFKESINGMKNNTDREWYASLMLNRLMFIYFVQKRRFLDDNPDYLRDCLHRITKNNQNEQEQSFYRSFLLRLFHEGLGCPKSDRATESIQILGSIPYLNGGLFETHDLEIDNPNIEISNEAFEKIFLFFDEYHWHLDDRPLHADNEINPEILGYIFEKYVNQKQMGAYYTKEDITSYISRNTIIPFLLDQVINSHANTDISGEPIWKLISDDPNRYISGAMQHGINYNIHTSNQLKQNLELPIEIAVGIGDTANRVDWNSLGADKFLLPTETWREYVNRRHIYEELCAVLREGSAKSISDLISYNLNIEQFLQDVISWNENPESLWEFWKALNGISILDPTCGSGAFLFAAVNILEPLYTTCIETMQSFLDEIVDTNSKGQESDVIFKFSVVLDQISKHANEQYFVLKSIIVNNLYGVDIMEEAVEICKLRLFLKIMAQLERSDQIEPLPDIDFNVRSGNTLVGFKNLKEIQDAFVVSPDGQRRMTYQEDFKKLKRINKDARNVNRGFYKFREMQTESDQNNKMSNAKSKTRKHLSRLEQELNTYLASTYGINADDQECYLQWRKNYKPFHWFVEFYRIMDEGGFDVIVGNPPYVEYSKIKRNYTLVGYQTLSCGNLYAYILERSLDLLRENGFFGMIVQLSISCTKRMKPIQDKLLEESAELWFSHFDDRPGKLFDNLEHIRATIILGQKSQHRKCSVKSTSYSRWYTEARKYLFDTLEYTEVGTHLNILEGSIPKLGSSIGSEIAQILLCHHPLKRFLPNGSGNINVYFHNAPQYWIRAMDFKPYFFRERDGERVSSHVKALKVSTVTDSKVIIAALNSSLFYWWFLTLSDCRDLNLRVIENFPLEPGEIPNESKLRLGVLSDSLMDSFQQYSTRRETENKRTGRVIYDEFDQKPTKGIVDEIDAELANYYGFTDEQLDYIVNYDIKFRMGLRYE